MSCVLARQAVQLRSGSTLPNNYSHRSRTVSHTPAGLRDKMPPPLFGRGGVYNLRISHPALFRIRSSYGSGLRLATRTTECVFCFTGRKELLRSRKILPQPFRGYCSMEKRPLSSKAQTRLLYGKRCRNISSGGFTDYNSRLNETAANNMITRNKMKKSIRSAASVDTHRSHPLEIVLTRHEGTFFQASAKKMSFEYGQHPDNL